MALERRINIRLPEETFELYDNKRYKLKISWQSLLAEYLRRWYHSGDDDRSASLTTRERELTDALLAMLRDKDPGIQGQLGVFLPTIEEYAKALRRAKKSQTAEQVTVPLDHKPTGTGGR